MSITIVAYGTQGDVQPLVALGKGLAAAGHHVRMIASSNFRPFVERHGLEAIASSVDVHAMMSSDDGKLWSERGTKPFEQMRIMRRLLEHTAPAMMREAWDACQGTEAVISTATGEPFATSIAERLAIPHLTALLAPAFAPTRSGAATWMPVFPERSSLLNYLSGKLLTEGAFYRLSADMINAFRVETLGLSRQSVFRFAAESRRRPAVLGYSAHVIPHPPDWPETFHTTGYWFIEDEPWEPPSELVSFLDAGERPVCVGFGSMTGRDKAALTQLVYDAVARTGRRAILLSGWGGIGDAATPPGILRIEAAPHAWLYPRMAAVVHHGGAGTTAAALRAGVPMVVVPHLGDQPYWGQRMRSLGVAPKPVPRPKLTAERLAEAIDTAASDSAMRKRAAELGTAIRAEDGIGEAIRVVERYLR
jgi:UDP:flavonoid glycosyltransferase YjiC (YdhE family)